MALTKEDLQAISQLLEEKLEEKFEKKFNEKLKPIEDQLKSVEVRFDEKLRPIENQLKTVEAMDIRLKSVEADIKDIKDSQRENSNMILAELDRVEERITGKFDNMKIDITQLREEVHVTKYSNDTVELLLKKEIELEKRISDLEEIA